ncbi:MAG: hypothetical protein HS126_05675 [Anaerolineales bacterium]|nr:hypothetical protein [Anaerolineales bacterium]
MERVAQGYSLHEFYEAVTQSKTPATSCQDNIKSLRMVFDVIKACETSQSIDSGGGSNERDGFNL